MVLKKIYKELALIRKELQNIRCILESQNSVLSTQIDSEALLKEINKKRMALGKLLFNSNGRQRRWEK